MRAAMLCVALLALAGCGSFKEAIGLHDMRGPEGTTVQAKPEDTPELDARAAEEREDLPHPPPPRDPTSWPNLGTVPPKPVLPTIAEIETATESVQTEQKQGAALIAAQAGQPEPQVLPKPARPATAPATPVAPVPVVTPPLGPYLSGAAGLDSGAESSVFSQDNQALLPQSQTIEQPDMLPPEQR